MTNQEAIKHLKTWTASIEKALNNPYNSEILRSEIEMDVDAMKMAIAALEKQEPKRTNDIKCDHIITGYCDMCGNYVNGTDNYCSECGQAIDWRTDDEPYR